MKHSILEQVKEDTAKWLEIAEEHQELLDHIRHVVDNTPEFVGLEVLYDKYNFTLSLNISIKIDHVRDATPILRALGNLGLHQQMSMDKLAYSNAVRWILHKADVPIYIYLKGLLTGASCKYVWKPAGSVTIQNETMELVCNGEVVEDVSE